jgi:hypothetical protein
MRGNWVVWVAAVWVLITVAEYAVLLWVLNSRGNLDTDAALSAAQVFTGLAGFGAGAVAVIALSRELRNPAPRLELTQVTREDGRFDLQVHNRGNAPAPGVTLAFAPKLVLDWLHGDAEWQPVTNPGADSDGWRRVPPLVVQGRIYMRSAAFTGPATVTMSADNVEPRTTRFIVLGPVVVHVTPSIITEVIRKPPPDAPDPPAAP